MSSAERLTPDQGGHLVGLLRARFFTRTDVVAALMPWGAPHPVDGGEHFEALLRAHVLGSAAPKALAHYRNRAQALKVESGHYRLGTYTPTADGRTCWACIDFDGAGHADGLADPQAAVLAAWRACAALGVTAHIERSGGGKGWHLWLLFAEPVSAADARRLALAIVPADQTLVSGRTADAQRNRGIEVFPKQEKVRKGGYGNLVWLPFWHGAPAGANAFYRLDEAGALCEYLPDDLAQITPAALAAALAALPPPASAEQPRARVVIDPEAVRAFLSRVEPCDDDAAAPAPSPDWPPWRKEALAVLPLEAVYGPWLTGASNSEHWLECRDPDSPSGDRDPSAGVADGTGEAARGTFHSFRTGKKLSVFDFMVEQGLAPDFKGAVRLVAELSGVPLPEAPKRAAKPAASSRASRGGYPVIVINGRQLRDIIADTRQVVNAANGMHPFLFNRTGQPVRLVNVDGKPHLDYLDDTAMYGVLARVADWVRRNEDGDFDVMPPHDVARDLVVNLDPALPHLDAVVTAPVFDAAGVLVATPGFHRDAGLWYHEPAGFCVPPVPDAPISADIAVARALLLDDLLVDFPFAGDSDRAHAVAAIILPFIRRMVSGSTPIHLVEAPIPGTGKTLLADAVTRIATGHQAEPMTLGRDDEETRKKITSVLALGKPVLLIDNVRTGIDSATLAAALTAETWQDRILGQTKMILLPNRAVWLVTANNPDLSMEIARRSVRIRIEPPNDRPWERGGFKHSPLTRWIDEHRAELVHAVLVLVRAWQTNGSPRGTRTLGSFEAWAEILGGILAVAGIPGFLENSEELYVAADRDGQEWREFVQAWWDDYGDEPQAVSTLLGLAKEKDLLPNVLGDKGERSQAIRLGKALASNRNRRFGAMQVRAGGPRDHQNRWRVVCDDQTAAPATPIQTGLDLNSPVITGADGMCGVHSPMITGPDGMCEMSDANIPPNIPFEKSCDFSVERDVREVRDVFPTPPRAITCTQTPVRSHAHSARGAIGENIPDIPHIPPSPESIDENGRDVGRDVDPTHPAHPSLPDDEPDPVDLADFAEVEV